SSEEIRDELARVAPERRCDRLAELSALAHTVGSLHLRGHGEIALHLDLSSSAVARRAFRLLRELGVESEIRTYRQHAFSRPTRYQLHVSDSDAARRVLVEAGVISRSGAPLQRPPKRVVGRECCRAAYVRGALLGAGSVSGPRSPHLEIRCASLEAAELLVRLVALEDISLHARDRGRHAIAYAKGADAIAETLAFAGASDAALLVDEHAVVGAARANANRLTNADQANLVRASRAAHRQLRAVRELEASGRLDTLPVPLREIADLRIRYPSLSLRELAAKCRPPATKASAHRRLTRLQRLAELAH
ncbi:MAG TPA: DNA-binding protein WhiA, partial [Gaiellaceae bacterium]|nr:DNA-binding protein WhiA [Gaiellaceae bacterium]